MGHWRDEEDDVRGRRQGAAQDGGGSPAAEPRRPPGPAALLLLLRPDGPALVRRRRAVAQDGAPAGPALADTEGVERVGRPKVRDQVLAQAAARAAPGGFEGQDRGRGDI